MIMGWERSRDALKYVVEVLEREPCNHLHDEARAWIQDILDQEGCEAYEGEKTLTATIDIIIAG